MNLTQIESDEGGVIVDDAIRRGTTGRLLQVEAKEGQISHIAKAGLRDVRTARHPDDFHLEVVGVDVLRVQRVDMSEHQRPGQVGDLRIVGFEQ
jgi:hypothetical protein